MTNPHQENPMPISEFSATIESFKEDAAAAHAFLNQNDSIAKRLNDARNACVREADTIDNIRADIKHLVLSAFAAGANHAEARKQSETNGAPKQNLINDDVRLLAAQKSTIESQKKELDELRKTVFFNRETIVRLMGEVAKKEQDHLAKLFAMDQELAQITKAHSQCKPAGAFVVPSKPERAMQILEDRRWDLVAIKDSYWQARTRYGFKFESPSPVDAILELQKKTLPQEPSPLSPDVTNDDARAMQIVAEQKWDVVYHISEHPGKDGSWYVRRNDNLTSITDASGKCITGKTPTEAVLKAYKFLNPDHQTTS